MTMLLILRVLVFSHVLKPNLIKWHASDSVYKGNYQGKKEFSQVKMSGFDSFKKAVGGGNKVGEEKSSGENHKVFPFSILKNFLLDLM